MKRSTRALPLHDGRDAGRWRVGGDGGVYSGNAHLRPRTKRIRLLVFQFFQKHAKPQQE